MYLTLIYILFLIGILYFLTLSFIRMRQIREFDKNFTFSHQETWKAIDRLINKYPKKYSEILETYNVWYYKCQESLDKLGIGRNWVLYPWTQEEIARFSTPMTEEELCPKL